MKASLAIAIWLSIVLHAMAIWLLDAVSPPRTLLLCEPQPHTLEVTLAQVKDGELDFGDEEEGQDTDPGESPDVASEAGEGTEMAGGSEAMPGWKKELLKTLKETKDLRNRYTEDLPELLPNKGGASDTYINRYRHYEDIIVKEVLPTLKTIDKPYKEILREAPAELERYQERNKIIREFRTGIKEKPQPHRIRRDKASVTYPPLQMPDSVLRKYLDRTLRLPKEKQLDLYMKNFGKYDPDRGDLPKVTRNLYYQNLQRLLYLFSPDRTVEILDYFEETLNKEDFLRNVEAMVANDSKSRNSAELRFALENIYEVQLNAVQRLLAYGRIRNSITPEQRKSLRIQTLERVYRKYLPLMTAKGILTEADAVRLYARRRRDILAPLTTGNYRSSDARFETGRIIWEAARNESDGVKATAMRAEAARIWKRPPSGTGDFLYNDSAKSIREALIRGNPEDPVTRSEIDGILYGRLQKQMADKRDREFRLLYPDTPAK